MLLVLFKQSVQLISNTNRLRFVHILVLSPLHFHFLWFFSWVLVFESKSLSADGCSEFLTKLFKSAWSWSQVKLFLRFSNFRFMGREVWIYRVFQIFWVVKKILVHGLFEHQMFLLFYCVTTAHIGLDILQMRWNLDIFHRLAALKSSTIVLQFMRVKRSARIMGAREYCLASMDSSQASPINSTSRLQQFFSVFNGKNTRHSFPVFHFFLEHEEEAKDKLLFS